MARTRGITVRTLTFPADVSPAYGYALAWKGTDAYVICTEGVGWKVTEDAPLTVDAWRKTDNGMCAVTFEMSLAEVITASVTGTDVDLADHIRTFGGRLDANHYQWHARLTGK